MDCLTHYMALFVLPASTGSPLFVVLFAITMLLDAPPCLYCFAIMALLGALSINPWSSPMQIGMYDTSGHVHPIVDPVYTRKMLRANNDIQHIAREVEWNKQRTEWQSLDFGVFRITFQEHPPQPSSTAAASIQQPAESVDRVDTADLTEEERADVHRYVPEAFWVKRGWFSEFSWTTLADPQSPFHIVDKALTQLIEDQSKSNQTASHVSNTQVNLNPLF
ncbi:hypothetical protein GQ42DRAFT_16752 [Ramicandelaber brevisporus]|nr:hypothetical protein GQ42DRAFT_16752 [Ramicandelaber brevisporus]